MTNTHAKQETITINTPPTPPSIPNQVIVSIPAPPKPSSSSSSTSVSISSSNTSYGFRAKFEKEQKSAIQKYLSEALNAKFVTKKQTETVWLKENGEGVIYEVRLSKNRLRIELDKELATGREKKRFERIGEELREIISETK